MTICDKCFMSVLDVWTVGGKNYCESCFGKLPKTRTPEEQALYLISDKYKYNRSIHTLINNLRKFHGRYPHLQETIGFRNLSELQVSLVKLHDGNFSEVRIAQ